MGWNDRQMEDPYLPPPEYYRDREEYEAWLEYVEMRLDEEGRGLTSQNLDPAMLPGAQQPGLLQRLWTHITERIHGQKKENNQENTQQGAAASSAKLDQETGRRQKEESETIPF